MLITVNALKNFLVEVAVELGLREACGLAQGHVYISGGWGAGSSPALPPAVGLTSCTLTHLNLSSWVVLSAQEGNCSVIPVSTSV